MLKIRRSPDRLIFNTGSPILVIRHLFIETVPGYQWIWSTKYDKVMHSSDYSFPVGLDQLLNKQSSCQWNEMPEWSCNVALMMPSWVTFKLSVCFQSSTGNMTGIHPYVLLSPIIPGCHGNSQATRRMLGFMSSPLKSVIKSGVNYFLHSCLLKFL